MQRKPRPLFDLLFSILLPSVILMKLSGPEALGAPGALVLALAFPISLGLYELVRFNATNWIAVLGLVSVLLTGGIGLLELDAGTDIVLSGSSYSGAGLSLGASTSLDLGGNQSDRRIR